MRKANPCSTTPSGTTSHINRRSVIGGLAASAASTTAMAARGVSADANLNAMVERHDALWTLTDRLYAALGDAGTDTAEYADANEEAADLERLIAATPAFTPAGLAGKRRMVDRAEMESSDDLGLIETILQLDAERVAAA
jgi:hypothetical protein